MGILIVIGQLFLSLSILIVLHEFGHFLPAKLFGTRVEKFYLFFDPWFSLFKFTKGGTEYGIGWLPLGGYVKIAGMVDESMDMEQMQQPEQPWEFRSKPVWQRLIIMLGGVIVNFVLGFLIWGLILFAYGTEYIPAENVTSGIYPDSLGIELGLQNGDHILKVGERDFDKFNEGRLRQEISINNANTILVRRNGQEVTLPVDKKFINILAGNTYKNYNIFHADYPWKINLVQKNTPAERAGLEVDDTIIAINGTILRHWTDVPKMVNGITNPTIALTVQRAGQPVDLTVNMGDAKLLGVSRYDAREFFDSVVEEYSFGEAMALGVTKGLDFLNTQIKAFGQMGKGNLNPNETMGGFASFAKLFPDTWNWQIFWRNTALISLILAFMNILPIPALDGGHVMFLMYEMITGRKPSDKFLQYSTVAGFALVLMLLLYANGLDVLRWWRGE